MQKKPRVVVVLGTGGTIAGLAATPSEHVNYVSAQVGVDVLVASLPGRDSGVIVESEQVAQIDSKDMEFDVWRRLALAVTRHLARAEVAGIVVTHGTDTLEETAYFLSRVVVATKAVVLTGAMRPSSAGDADGPGNLAVAIAVATSEIAPAVVVAFAAAIHAARDVRKAHPQRLDAFSSGERGVLGRVVDGRIEMLREPVEPVRPVVAIAAWPDDPAAWPRVEIVTGAAGVDGRVVDLLAADGVDGIVVAATGNGTIHLRLELALQRAVERGVAVVRSTRCLDGAVVDTAASTLPSAGDLTPVKARVEMILGLLAAR